MKILITGGAGYLGSILCQKAISQEHKVVCYDNGIYGYQGIGSLIPHKNFRLVKEDIRNLITLSQEIKKADAVVHLASIVGMPASNIDPKTALEINYIATKNIAELCTNRNIEKFIFASTCSVYGNQPDKMITESSKVDPLDNYAKHKFDSEKAIHQLYNTPTILRFGTLFGLSPRLRFDLVVNKFIAQALTGSLIEVYGGGLQMRPFLHVVDAAKSILFVLSKGIEGTYNIISQNNKIYDIARIITNTIPCGLKIIDKNPDNRNYKVSMAKIYGFGFETSRNIEFAIREFQNLFDKQKIDWKDPKYSNYDSLILKNSN